MEVNVTNENRMAWCLEKAIQSRKSTDSTATILKSAVTIYQFMFGAEDGKTKGKNSIN